MGVDAAGKTVPRGIARETVVVGTGHTRTAIRISIGFDGTEGTVTAVVYSVADRIVLKEAKRVAAVVS